jgi:hypothetical protein
MRTGGVLYQEVGKDSLSNLYQMTLLNKTNRTMNLDVKVDNFPAEIRVVGNKAFKAPPEGQTNVTMFIVLPKAVITTRDKQLKIGVYENGKRITTKKTSFLGYTQ